MTICLGTKNHSEFIETIGGRLRYIQRKVKDYFNQQKKERAQEGIEISTNKKGTQLK
jgi:hypothetical protein